MKKKKKMVYIEFMYNISFLSKKYLISNDDYIDIRLLINLLLIKQLNYK